MRLQKREFRYVNGIGNLLLGVTCVAWVAAAAGPAPALASEWDNVVAAAKKEGKVVVAQGGGSGSEIRRLFSEGFHEKYPQIDVDLTVAGGRSIAPRVLTERRVGKYLWDVYMGGITTAATILLPAGVFDPMKPALLLPEVGDVNQWFGRELEFADPQASSILVFGGYVIPPFAYNTGLVKKSDIRSFEELLEPKWRGKIVMNDPRQPGSGLASAIYWYTTPGLGKEFIRRFFTEQDVKLSRDYRQQMAWLARGDYLLAIGHNNDIYKEFLKNGLPVGLFTADDVKEGSYINAAVAGLGLINRAPHPNAARVYLNWLLSKETQTRWSKISGFWSRRLDVPSDHLDPATVPRKGKAYRTNYQQDWVEKSSEVAKFVRSLVQ